jgi:2-polyprenyl-3-methyl-5-hydroxy-6-metoxy-1,4-benzoquinol methylase
MPTCLLCGPDGLAEPLFQARRPIYRCRCGLAFAGRTEGEDLAAAYDEGYFRGGVYADYLGDREPIRRNAARVLSRLEREVKGRRLLDVGCAAGFFLEAARERGWSTFGLELSSFGAQHAREVLKLDVEQRSILEPPDGLGPFDVITLWDVIEHIDDPGRALRIVRRMIADGGRVLVSTGDVRSWLARLTRSRWRLFADPTHLWFFDEDSLGRLLEQAGFRVVSAARHGKHVSLAMALHQAPLPGAAALSRWLARRGSDLFVYVNPRDVMTLEAEPA